MLGLQVHTWDFKGVLLVIVYLGVLMWDEILEPYCLFLGKF